MRDHSMTRTGRGIPEDHAFHVGLVIPSFRGGGAEATTVRLANCLADRDLVVDLVVLDGRGPWRQLVQPRVRLVDLGVTRVRRALHPLIGYLKNSLPDAILAGPSHLSVLTILARRVSRAPTAILVLEHSDWRARERYPARFGDRVLPWLVRLAYPYADRVLAVSRGSADSLAAILGKPSSAVGVLYNGVDAAAITKLAAATVDHPWFSEQAPPLLLSVGRLVPEKGFDQLIRAVALLRSRGPTRLAILGEGEQRARLEVLVRELGLTDSVAFLGFQANPYAYMAKASAFVLASRFEGFGIVLVEALACGLPVVAVDCPSGPREILQDGRFGVLVPADDPSALADSLGKLLADHAMMAGLRAHGLDRARDFSIDHAADTLMGILQGLGGPSIHGPISPGTGTSRPWP